MRRQNSPAWLAGAVLIGLGAIFMLQNLGIPLVGHWWALFILIPAFGLYTVAWNAFQNADGMLTPAATGPLTGAVILTLIAAIFLLSLSWGVVWPVFLIVAGLGALIGGAARRY